MQIELVRIDDRLIHGQIVEGWLKTIRVNHIVVVSDAVAGDRMQQILLSMAAPGNVKVTSFSVEEGARAIRGDGFGDDRVLLLLSCPRDVLRLLEQGVGFPSVNVGGMHFSQGKRQLLRNLSVDDEDVRALRSIGAMGVELEGRVLPPDDRVDVLQVIERECGGLS